VPAVGGELSGACHLVDLPEGYHAPTGGQAWHDQSGLGNRLPSGRRVMLPGMTGILTETARTVPISFRDDQQQRDPANLTVRSGDRVGNRDSLSLPR
jgi:hypothetical protein